MTWYRSSDSRKDDEQYRRYVENVGRKPVTLYPEGHPAYAQWTYKSPAKKADKAMKSVAAAGLTRPGLPIAFRNGGNSWHAVYDQEVCDRYAERMEKKLTCKHENARPWPQQTQVQWRGKRGGWRKATVLKIRDTCNCRDCYQDVSVKTLPIEAFDYWHGGEYEMTFQPCEHETVNVFTGCCAGCGESVRRLVAA